MDSFNYYSDLISHLVRRDFSLRYKRSVLGVLWSLLLPLAQLLVLVFLFQKVVPLKIEAYPAFVFSALLPWTWFSTCLGSAGNLFIGNRDLMRRPNFEPSTLIIVNTLSNLLLYLVSLPILFIVLVLYNRAMTPALAVFPFLILVQSVLIIGLGMITATLNVFYSDIQQIVSVLIMLLFYMTPVFYSPTKIDENYRILYNLNPIAVLVESYRDIFFYGIIPNLGSLVVASVISAFLCGLGYLIYSRQLHNVIDAI